MEKVHREEETHRARLRPCSGRRPRIKNAAFPQHRAEDYFRKVIYDKLHFYYICKT